MEQFEALEIIRQSESFSRQLAKIETGIFTWAEKQKLFRMFFKQASRYKKVIEEFPEEWLRASSHQFVAGYVFGNSGRLHKYLHNNRDFIDKESKSLLHHFMDSPWFYSLFQITESYPDNILKARDCSGGEEFYLYSEGTANLFKQGKNLFMALLFDNGKCRQTYGIIHYYQGYSVRDFTGFAYLVSYHYRNSRSLSESVKNKPLEYMLLDRFAEIPFTVHKGEQMVFCSHSRKVESFDPEEYSRHFLIEEKNDVVKCTLKKYQDTMFFTCLYFDKMKNNLTLNAVGVSRYREMTELLKNKYDFPREPSWCFTTQMMIAVDTVLGIKNPSLAYDKYFDTEPPVQGESSPDLKPINDLMRELTDYSNAGKKYSIQELASKHDVPVETALQLENMLKNMDKKLNIDLEGGSDDIVPPPPDKRHKLKDPPNQNPF
ncbi:MAG: hypothetical protein JW969_14910 [Spirochaetales bacterium]|nr:hypothetical protein [Spirochaetales bacterium]